MVRRITTNGTMYSYKSTLQRTYRGLVDASNKMMTNRRFNSYSEDPAAASRAFQLRRARWNTEAQISNNDAVSGKFSQGWDALEKVYNDLGRELGEYSVLRGKTDSTASGRKALGQSLMATAESIVFTMNSKYADEYIFAGADGLRAPFAWDDDGDLTFRGIKVDTDPNDPRFDGEKAVCETAPVPKPASNGDTMNVGGYSFVVADVTKDLKDILADFAADYNANVQGWTASVNAAGDGIVFTAQQAGKLGGAQNTAGQPTGSKVINAGKDEDVDGRAAAKEAQDAIKKMLGETTFVDLGMGMEEGSDGKIKPATAFNSALCGLKYLGGSDSQDVYGGYGLDEDGDPRNFVTLLKKAGELLYNTDQDTGDWEKIENVADMDRLTKKIQDSLGKVSLTHVDLDTDVAFLKSNKDRLKALDDTLNDQIVGTEDMDPAESITALMWAQYSYNAALKIGNGILSNSLLDYLS